MHQKKNLWQTHQAAVKQNISHPLIWTVTQRASLNTSRPPTSNTSQPVMLNTAVPVTAGTSVPLTPNTSPSTSYRTRKMNASLPQRWVHKNQMKHPENTQINRNSKHWLCPFSFLQCRYDASQDQVVIHAHQPWAVELSLSPGGFTPAVCCCSLGFTRGLWAKVLKSPLGEDLVLQ